jgi:glycosyltransferase involved in cell wall biosynthesis
VSEGPLKILHCFRSPVGGIFRHVRDLAKAQNAAGHRVGILCDSTTGGEHEERLFDAIRGDLALGLTRIPMDRAIGPSDMMALWRAWREIGRLAPDILHSHGAKGGAYARVIGTLLRIGGHKVARLYCPHGGSIHYDAGRLSGRLYFRLERALEAMTDRLIFVSRYEQAGYAEKIGSPRVPFDIVYNGLSQEEFAPVAAKAGAADFLYIGMMRDLKGPDVFLDALARVAGDRPATAHFVGDGPDKDTYIAQIGRLGLGDRVTVHAAMPARRAFALARCVVVPSRAESMPYLVLEALAAGKPVIATRVGGIPEIFAESAGGLVEADNAGALALRMRAFLDNPHAVGVPSPASLKARFSVAVMAATVEGAYRRSLTRNR